LVGGTGWYLGAGRYTHTPRLVGLTKPAAEAVLHTAGLSARYAPTRFDETVPAGSVLDQSPGPDARVSRHGTVRLVLSKGPDRRGVPDVTRLSVDAATAALVAAGLTVGPTAQEYSTLVPAGQVIRTNPAPGQKLRPGTAVALVVSKGVELLPVPDEAGKPQAEAAQALRSAGFTPVLAAVFSDTVAPGLVVAQTPHDGTAARGATVALQVSKGPQLVAVPDETGQSVQAAQADLAAKGLSSTVRSIPGPGIVRNQSPAPGTMVRKGTVVTLYVF
nr:PASTA domain-containing protein [Actinomycetota bacterium]